MDEKQKRWKTIAIIALTVSAILVGVVIALVNHIAVAAEQDRLKSMDLNIRRQSVADIMAGLIYSPLDLPTGMEAYTYSYSEPGSGSGLNFYCHYKDAAGSWFDIGIITGDIDSNYAYQSDKQINGHKVSVYSGSVDVVMIAYCHKTYMTPYKSDDIHYFVRGNLSETYLDTIMAGYLNSINI